MGILDRVRGPDVYLDTNILVYALEGHERYRTILTELFTAFDKGEVHPLTSSLSLAETLVRPFKTGDMELVQAYQHFLCGSSILELVHISEKILVEAARLRAVASLKLPDAIHAATAVLSGAVTFLTNDRAFLQVLPEQCVLLDEL